MPKINWFKFGCLKLLVTLNLFKAGARHCFYLFTYLKKASYLKKHEHASFMPCEI